MKINLALFSASNLLYIKEFTHRSEERNVVTVYFFTSAGHVRRLCFIPYYKREAKNTTLALTSLQNLGTVNVCFTPGLLIFGLLLLLHYVEFGSILRHKNIILHQNIDPCLIIVTFESNW